MQWQWNWGRGRQYYWSPSTGGSLPWWFYALFIGAGLGMLIGGGLWTRSTQSFVAAAQRAEGQVVGYNERADSDDSGTLYYPVVRFTTAEGREVEFEGESGSSFRYYRQGGTVQVLYDPTDPQHAVIAVFMELWFGPALLLFMGLLFTAIGISVWFAVRRQQARFAAAGRAPDGSYPAPGPAGAGPPGARDELRPGEDEAPDADDAAPS